MTSDNKDTKIDPLLFIDQELIKQFICPLCKYLLNEPTMDRCGCSILFCKNRLVIPQKEIYYLFLFLF